MEQPQRKWRKKHPQGVFAHESPLRMQEELLRLSLVGVLCRGGVYVCVDNRTATVLEGLLLGRIATPSSLPEPLAHASWGMEYTPLRLSPEEAFFMSFAMEVLTVLTDAESIHLTLLPSDRLRVVAAGVSDTAPTLVQAPHVPDTGTSSSTSAPSPAAALANLRQEHHVHNHQALQYRTPDANITHNDDEEEDDGYEGANAYLADEDDDEVIEQQHADDSVEIDTLDRPHAESTAAAFTPQKRKLAGQRAAAPMPAPSDDAPEIHGMQIDGSHTLGHLPLMHRKERPRAPPQVAYFSDATQASAKLSDLPLQQPSVSTTENSKDGLSPGTGLLHYSEHGGLVELDHETLWRSFACIDPVFPACYAAYHHCRANGWLPKSGLQYGADYVLYRAHPAVAHSEYVAVVLPEASKVGGTMRQRAKRAGYPDWRDQQAISRLSIQVSKGVLALHVEGGQRGFITSTPQCLLHLRVHSLQIVRWNPNRAMKNMSAEGGGAAGDANEIDAQAVDPDELENLGGAIGDDD